MSFLHPALLLALPAILLPLLIHLLDRRRFHKKPWGAMMFLREAMEEKRGLRKVHHWLLLALRMLAIAALVLAMSRPLIGGWLAGWAGGGDRAVFLVMDRSASMERQLTAGGPSKRQRALAMLGEACREVNPSQLWLFDSAEGEARALRSWDELDRQLPPTDGAAEIPAMLLGALSFWRESQATNGELWIVSDLQASNWQPQRAEVWADLQATYTKLATPPALRLLSLTGGPINRSIRCRADDPNRKLAVTIGQDGSLTGKTTIPLTLEIGNQRTVTQVSLEGATTTLRFGIPSEGEIIGSVSLPGDGNDRDNVAHFAFGPPTRPKVSILCENQAVEAVLVLAVAPLQRLAEVDRGLPNGSWEDLALVLWQGDLPAEDTRQRLRHHVASGGKVLFFPGAKGSTSGAWEDVRYGAPESAEQPLAIRHWLRDEGPLRDTRTGEALPLSLAQTSRYAPILQERTGALASMENEMPWLLSRPQAEGAAYFCATLPLDGWSTLGEGPVLVPLVQRLLARGRERLSPVRWQAVDRHPWQTGVRAREGGWDVMVRPLAEDAPGEISEETLPNLLGDIPYQQFTVEGSGPAQDALREWWRTALFLALLFLLLESTLTMMPRQRRPPLPAT